MDQADVGEIATDWLELAPDVLRQQAQELALRVMQIDDLEMDVPVMDAGMDSIESVDFRQQVERKLPGIVLPGALVLEYPTIKELSEYLLRARESLQKERASSTHSQKVIVLDEELQDADGNVKLPNDFPLPQPPCTRSGGALGGGAILLTGATGFLGAHIGSELLECTSSLRNPPRLVVVIRSNSKSAGMQRLIDAFSEYNLQLTEAHRRRVDVLPTQDMSLPNLGLGENIVDELRKAGVHSIIHNAATVNWFKRYEQLKPTNVSPTLALLTFAAQLGAKFGYVSSISTLPLSNPDNCVDESCDNGWSKVNVLKMSGYSQTKWISEQLCLTACRQGIAVSVFRMPFIIGHTQTGCMNITDTPARMIAAVVQLGQAPVSVSLDCVAVDLVARVCGRVSLRPSTSGVNPATGKLTDGNKNFCVTHISTKFGKVGMEKIFEQLRVNGYTTISWIARNDWIQKAMEQQTAAAPIQVFDRLFNRPGLVNSMRSEDIDALELPMADILEVTSDVLNKIIAFLQNKQMLSPVKVVQRRSLEQAGSYQKAGNKATKKHALDYEACRKRCEEDPERYHGSVAARNLHWYHPERKAWLSWCAADGEPSNLNEWSHGSWEGFSVVNAEVRGRDSTGGSTFEPRQSPTRQTSMESRRSIVEKIGEEESWLPWSCVLDDSAAPFYKWFVGGQTNAAMNEVDRHVVHGYGDETAYICDSYRSTQGSTEDQTLTRRQLFAESAIASLVLSREPLKLSKGDRVMFYLPTKAEQLVWSEACKRLGVIYSTCTPGLVPSVLAERVCELEPSVIITTQSLASQRWSSNVAAALADFFPVKWILDGLKLSAGQLTAEQSLRRASSSSSFVTGKSLGGSSSSTSYGSLNSMGLGIAITEAHASLQITFGSVRIVNLSSALDQISSKVKNKLKEIDSDMAQGAVAHLLSKLEHSVQKHCEQKARDRGLQILMIDQDSVVDGNATSIASNTLDRNEEKPAFKNVVCHYSSALCSGALEELGIRVGELPEDEVVKTIWDHTSAPEPVEANFPLFVCYTSGSCSKPRGIVHCHGYAAGVSETLKWCFDAVPGKDRLLAVSQPGWIVGQSYMYTAPLCSRITSVAMEGSPVRPVHTRFADVIVRHKVTMLKAGSTFLREIMSYPKAVKSLRKDFDFSRVRIATFCSEPLSPQVQAFAMQNVCPQYINSYWSTEHGGITFSRSYDNPDQLLIANAHSWPLPWIFGDVVVVAEDDEENSSEADEANHVDMAPRVVPVRVALPGESGDVAIMKPWPYQMRCVWGDAAHVGEPSWRGAEEGTQSYWTRVQVDGEEPKWVFLQRDFAQRQYSGGFTFHGRSDEVMNLCGMTIGTETIESAILRDKYLNPESSPIGDCAVVGHPHPVYGEMPLAFVTPSEINHRLKEVDITRLTSLVFEAVGNVGIQFLQVPALPRTQTGKILRSLLRALIKDERLSFLQAARSVQNPDCLRQLQSCLKEWRELHTHFSMDIAHLDKVESASAVLQQYSGESSDLEQGLFSSMGKIHKSGSLTSISSGVFRPIDRSGSSASLASSTPPQRRNRESIKDGTTLIPSQQQVLQPHFAQAGGGPVYVTIELRHLVYFTAGISALFAAVILSQRRR